MKNRRPHGFYWFLLSILLVLGASASSRAQTPPPPPGFFVITNNTDLTNIVNGGYFTFATNGTFTFSNQITISSDTIIDGSGLDVTLTGIYSNRLFFINPNVELSLINVAVTGGKNAQGAAIYNNLGVLYAGNVTFGANHATNGPGPNGAPGSSGSINGKNGGGGASAQGGAIYSNKGYVILTNCLFTNNIAIGGNGGNGGDGFNGLGGNGGNGGDGGVAMGGAIFSNGTNWITGCYFLGNGVLGGSGGAGGSAGTGGGSTGAGGQGNTAAAGAIYIPAGGILNLTNCSFVANQAFGGDSAPQSISAAGFSSNAKNGGPALGGVIENFGISYAENCTFFTNTAWGGAGGATLGDSSANAGAGGYAMGAGVCNYAGTFTARNCTFATNNAIGGTNGVSPFSNRNGATGLVEGGNLARYAGTLIIRNCILQHGTGNDSWNGVTDGDYNVSSDTSCGFKTPSHSLSKTNALLSGTLSFYPGYPPLLEFFGGGTTNTTVNGTNSIVSTNKSPAQDFIPALPSLDDPTNAPLTDGRGFPRFTSTNTLADAGAFEFVPSPPRILTQPQDVYASKGSTATFSVFANGEAPLFYQWLFMGTNSTNGSLIALPLATNTSLTISNIQTTNYGSYSVVVSNSLGFVVSSNAVLSPILRPTITNRPLDLEVAIGATAVFTVQVAGAPLNFQWFFNNTALTDSANISGVNTASLTISDAVAADQGTYKVVVTNSAGSDNTTVQLTVDDPAITSGPADLTVNYGAPAVFSVAVASSTNAIAYMWHHGTNTAVIGTQASYTNSPATNSDTFFVVVSNKFGGSSAVVTSAVATLTVLNPVLTIPPTNLVVDAGSSAIFTAAGAGSGKLTYQWYFNGTPIAQQTNTSLTISPAGTNNAGSYTVSVSNAVGTVTSSPATLTVRGFSSITGRVTFGTNGVPGIIIADGQTNSLSGPDGSYSFDHLLAGTYVITPVQIGSGLTPATNVVVVDGANATNNINFAFNPPALQITSTPTNDVVPLHILSAPSYESILQSSTNLTNWTDILSITTDTNGTWNVTVTNTAATPEYFLRLIAP